MAIFEKPATRAAVALVATAAISVALIHFLGEHAYDWVKAIHVMSVIAWMAGMLYLPRLFVYHCTAAPGSEMSETFKIMERRLLRIIMNPAMILTWVLGLWMAWQQQWHHATWFQLKFVLVLAMSAVHGHLSASVRRFAEDRNQRSERYWRLMNEAPTLLMIAIVILVIVKPF